MRLRNPLVTFWERRGAYFQHSKKHPIDTWGSTVYRTYGFEYYSWGHVEGYNKHLHINFGYHFWEWEW